MNYSTHSEHSTSALHDPSQPHTQAESDRINEEIAQLKADDIEERIREESPDGRAAYPSFRAKEIVILAVGSIFAILAISGVTYALWGLDEALMVLGFGVMLAVAGNPVVWAMIMRGKEREEINHDADGSKTIRAQHSTRTR